MKNIAFTTKIGEQQLKRLRGISSTTGIPQSALVRKGIDLVLRQMEQDMPTVEFKSAVERVVSRNRGVFEALAKRPPRGG